MVAKTWAGAEMTHDVVLQTSVTICMPYCPNGQSINGACNVLCLLVLGPQRILLVLSGSFLSMNGTNVHDVSKRGEQGYPDSILNLSLGCSVLYQKFNSVNLSLSVKGNVKELL